MSRWEEAGLSPRVRAKLVVLAAMRDARRGMRWNMADLERAMAQAIAAHGRDAGRSVLAALDKRLRRLFRSAREGACRACLLRSRRWLRQERNAIGEDSLAPHEPGVRSMVGSAPDPVAEG